MSVEFLVRTTSLKIFEKGAISQTVKESPATWGDRERLPNWIRVRVTDATKADIDKYNQEWLEKFVVKDSPAAIIIERADKGKIGRINLSSEKVQRVKERFKELGLTAENVNKVNGDIYIDKVVTLEQVQDIVSDFMTERHKHRRYHVKGAVVDNAIAKNKDLVEITLAQLEANLVDGLN